MLRFGAASCRTGTDDQQTRSAGWRNASRRFGIFNLPFGGLSRPELPRAAQARTTEVFVLATDDPEANLRTARRIHT